HASVVVHVNARDRADQPVGRHRRDAPADEIVLAVVPPARDEVAALFEPGDQARDVARIVLAVRVERDDDVTGRPFEPGSNRRRLAEVAPEAYDAHVRVLVADATQRLERSVARAVVDVDDLVAAAEIRKRGGQLRMQRHEVVDLVVDRQHDGDVHQFSFLSSDATVRQLWKSVIAMNWRKRVSISERSRRRRRLSPKSSTVNDATTVPNTIARRSERLVTSPSAARLPNRPPAKLSPAPVGSTTFSSGNAGTAKISWSEN